MRDCALPDELQWRSSDLDDFLNRHEDDTAANPNGGSSGFVTSLLPRRSAKAALVEGRADLRAQRPQSSQTPGESGTSATPWAPLGTRPCQSLKFVASKVNAAVNTTAGNERNENNFLSALETDWVTV